MERFTDESLSTYKYRQEFVNKYKLKNPDEKMIILLLNIQK